MTNSEKTQLTSNEQLVFLLRILIGCPTIADDIRQQARDQIALVSNEPACDEALVLRICTAYEHGVGQSGRDLTNPYCSPMPENAAWNLGFQRPGPVPVVTDRMQGVDCPDCEESIPHTHASETGDVRQATRGHFWYVEELHNGDWIRSAVGHSWALESDARQQCEELRRRYGNRIYRVAENEPHELKAVDQPSPVDDAEFGTAEWRAANPESEGDKRD